MRGLFSFLCWPWWGCGPSMRDEIRGLSFLWSWLGSPAYFYSSGGPGAGFQLSDRDASFSLAAYYDTSHRTLAARCALQSSDCVWLPTPTSAPATVVSFIQNAMELPCSGFPQEGAAVRPICSAHSPQVRYQGRPRTTLCRSRGNTR